MLANVQYIECLFMWKCFGITFKKKYFKFVNLMQNIDFSFVHSVW